MERFGAHGHGTSIYVRDPDGHHLELKQYNLPADLPPLPQGEGARG